MHVVYGRTNSGTAASTPTWPLEEVWTEPLQVTHHSAGAGANMERRRRLEEERKDTREKDRRSGEHMQQCLGWCTPYWFLQLLCALFCSLHPLLQML